MHTCTHPPTNAYTHSHLHTCMSRLIVLGASKKMEKRSLSLILWLKEVGEFGNPPAAVQRVPLPQFDWLFNDIFHVSQLKKRWSLTQRVDRHASLQLSLPLPSTGAHGVPPHPPLAAAAGRMQQLLGRSLPAVHLSVVDAVVRAAVK